MSLIEKIDKNRLPRHVAIIMDGNGRWAKAKGKDRSFGHQEGVVSVRKIMDAVTQLGLKYLTLYTFSTENWNRPEEEVQALMSLLVSAIHRETPDMMKKNVRLTAIGDLSRLREDAYNTLQECIDTTSANTGTTLVLALSYSSRWEITRAARQLAQEVLEQKINPICQPEFARDLLRAAKERGINTAIESMACVPWKNIEMVLPYLDTYLMDIKHTNQEKHKQFTGKPNGLALENARKVALSGQTNLVIRVPVVPTFNDSVEEIKSIASFAATLPGVKKIHLLPYHRLGQDKYDWLGREYKLPEILPPEPEHMELLKKAVHSVCDLDCQIGG